MQLTVTTRPRLQAYQAGGVLFLRALLRLLALLPRSLITMRVEWLRWLRDELQLQPAHPGLAEIALEIRELEVRYGLPAQSPRAIGLVRRSWVAFVRCCR